MQSSGNPLASDKNALRMEIQSLREQLQEAEEILDAIRNGRVDALVVPGPGGNQIYTLKGADQSYRIMIETMNEGAAVLSREGTVLYCNRQFAQMLRSPMRTIIGGAMASLVDPVDMASFEDLQQRIFKEKELKIEFNLLSGEGHKIPVLLSMRYFSTEEQDAVCMVVTDLTDLKKSQFRFKEYAKEVHRKNEELKLRTNQLRRLSAELTETEHRERNRLAKILHDDLQQLLVSVRFSLETLEGRLHNDNWQTVENAISVINESLNVSRSLSVELSPPILYESGLIPAIEWLVRWMKEKHGLTVTLSEHNARETPLREDIKLFLFSAIRELLLNVVKHAQVMEAKVEVRVEGPPANDQVKIVVSDSGRGRDPSLLLNESHDLTSRFGLFSIYERMQLLGGESRIATSPGKGMTVMLTTPIRSVGKTEAVEIDRVIQVKLNDEVSATPLATRLNKQKKHTHIRIILADDHDVMRQGLSMLLSNYTDIEIVGEASDGEAAVQLAHALDPDVILMDISMPKMNGIEATRIINAQKPDIRIIGLSMFDAEDKAEAIRNAGAAAYLKKTGNKVELINTIRDVVTSD